MDHTCFENQCFRQGARGGFIKEGLLELHWARLLGFQHPSGMMDTMEEAPKMNAENMLKVFDLKKKRMKCA